MGATKLNHEDDHQSSGNTRSLSIYGYTNYRTYLKDFYAFRKDGQHGYSYRSFSKAAGFTSPNILKLVIEGQRNISPDAIEKFLVALRLKGPMAEYFRALVKMNQAKSDDEREKWFHTLARITPHASRRQLNTGALQYLSNWLYPVLREMVTLKDFRFDPYWISRRLRRTVSLSDIVQAWNFLVEEGYLEQRPDGSYAAKDRMVASSDEITSLAIRNYHRQMLGQAVDALETLPVGEREFGALVLNIPASAVDELKFRIKAFRKEMHEWAMQAAGTAADRTSVDAKGTGAADESHTDLEQVVQVNIQMYPHTRKVAP